MAQASHRLPKLITLVWGRDRLEVDDPIWIAKIVQEMAQSNQTDEYFRVDLSWPRSRRNERIEANLVAMGLRSSYEDTEAPEIESGYQVPDQQNPVAAETLRLFLGLEMPVALNFTSYRGRSEHRLSAVHTAFKPCWRSSSNELQLQWIFSGYQLYASHHIGQPHLRPFGTETMGGDIERRLLNGKWVRWGFDGALPLPPGRQWSSNRRIFILTGSGIQRVDQSETDLMPEHDDEFVDNEDGIPPPQEAM